MGLLNLAEELALSTSEQRAPRRWLVPPATRRMSLILRAGKPTGPKAALALIRSVNPAAQAAPVRHLNAAGWP